MPAGPRSNIRNSSRCGDPFSDFNGCEALKRLGNTDVSRELAHLNNEQFSTPYAASVSPNKLFPSMAGKTAFAFLASILAVSWSFIPHPLVKVAGKTPKSITHKEITEKAIIRSVVKYYDSVSEVGTCPYLTPYTSIKAIFLKRFGSDLRYNRCLFYHVMSVITSHNAMEDIRKKKRSDPVIHFDSEQIRESNRYLINPSSAFRIVVNIKNGK
ncbi:hypothetical protein ACOME3_007377 [Neoechinorhynchus agilis]